MTQPGDDFEAPDQESLVDDVDEMLDAGYSPPERYRGEGFGTTATETREGESIDERMRQEEPDPDPYAETDEILDDGEVGNSRAGRLVDPEPDSVRTTKAHWSPRMWESTAREPVQRKRLCISWMSDDCTTLTGCAISRTQPPF